MQLVNVKPDPPINQWSYLGAVVGRGFGSNANTYLIEHLKTGGCVWLEAHEFTFINLKTLFTARQMIGDTHEHHEHDATN